MKAVKPAQVPIWERRRRKKKKTRIIRLIFVVIIGLIVVNLAFKLPGLYRDFNQPFPRFPDEDEKTHDLDNSFRTNYLLVSYKGNWLQDVAIASYEPEDRRLSLLLLDLPENKELRLAANKSFRSGRVSKLSQQISVEMGIILDRYLAFEIKNMYFGTGNAAKTHMKLRSVGIFFKIIPLKRDLNKYLKTNFTTPELISFLWNVRGSKFEEKDVTSLGGLGLTDPQTEEGSEELSNLFFDRSIINEGASISIRNSSGIAGLGNSLAFYLENLGASVVVVEVGEEISQENLFITRNRKKYVEKRLSSFISFKKSKVDEEEFSGDILVVIGESVAGELTLP
jgi:hypothetical protein